MPEPTMQAPHQKRPEPIRFTVLGLPQGKGRPRVTKTGHAYTPAKTIEAEGNFRAQAVRFAPFAPLEGPVRARLTFFMPIPGSWSGKKRRAAADQFVLPASRPDLDNLGKLCLDAMNAIFWRDDAQLVAVHLVKRYTPLAPRVDVEVEVLR